MPFFQSANGIIILFNSFGIIEYVNPGFCNDKRFSEAELIGTTPKKMKSGLKILEVYEDVVYDHSRIHMERNSKTVKKRWNLLVFC